MSVELGSVSLAHITHVAVRERARVVRHAVPGLAGELLQDLGRPSVEVELHGSFYGDGAAAELKQLRQVSLERKPIDFFTEAVGEGYFAQVIITELSVQQRVGHVDQFDFACTVVEYVEPPEPAFSADPLAAIDGELAQEAGAYLDDVQDAIAQVSELSALIANVPRFGDPTTRLASLLEQYTPLVEGGAGALAVLEGLF